MPILRDIKFLTFNNCLGTSIFIQSELDLFEFFNNIKKNMWCVLFGGILKTVCQDLQMEMDYLIIALDHPM